LEGVETALIQRAGTIGLDTPDLVLGRRQAAATGNSGLEVQGCRKELEEPGFERRTLRRSATTGVVGSTVVFSRAKRTGDEGATDAGRERGGRRVGRRKGRKRERPRTAISR
jgi:hypothetical protein